jgi:hypothetical protein
MRPSALLWSALGYLSVKQCTDRTMASSTGLLLRGACRRT